MIASLDWLLHHPLRLGMMMAFAQRPHKFTEIKHLLNINPGRLSLQAHLLESHGYLERSVHATTGKMHATFFSVTPEGIEAMRNYYQTSSEIGTELRRLCQK